MADKLTKFRTRWNRWIGQKTRCNGVFWVDLLDTNWMGWAERVFDSHGQEWDFRVDNSTSVHLFYSTAIQMATMEELLRLDNLYALEKCK